MKATIMKAIAVFVASFFLPGVYSQRPSNDECINATVIPGNSGTTSNYTTDPIDIKLATVNTSDPITNCSFFSYEDPRGTDGATLWFTWRPQLTGEYEFSTEGTYAVTNAANDDFFFVEDLLAVVGVYEGNTCDDIEAIKCARPPSKVRTDLTAETKYYIKVGISRAFRGGTLRLIVRPAPPAPSNTKCVDAITLDPIKPNLITGDITNALIDEAAISCADITFGFNKGLWYKYTNTLSTQVSATISTCYDDTDFDTIISVFEQNGTDCDALSCIWFVDDVNGACGTKAVYSFFPSPLTTYFILIQGFEGSEGNFTLGFTASENYFVLIDADRDRIIEPIGGTVDYSSVTSNLNIQAVFSDESVIGSVLVKFDDPAISFCEEFPPFSVFWDTEGDYFAANPVIPIGPHTVSATSYAQDGCSGTVGATLSKDFEVVGCYVDYTVYDVNTLSPVYYMYANNFFIFDVDPMPCDVNIQVSAFCGSNIETVQIELRNTATGEIVASNTEMEIPYYLFGNIGDTVTAGSIVPGSYTISATVDGLKYDTVAFTVRNVCVQT